MLNIFLFFITLVIGLVLFLFALNLMSITINRIINDKIKKLIFCFTDNSFYGLIIGTIITALIQSSSLVTVLTIALVKAKVINLKQSLAIIMGANIGTTMTTFMTGIDLEKFTMFFFIISIFSFFINKNTSNFFLSLALLLFGLGLMGISTKFIFKLDMVYHFFLKMMEHKNLAVFTGFLVTAILQSSTAVTVIIQAIYSNQEISLQVALLLLLGTNIGTTITGLIAAIGKDKEAKRVALFHLIFNILGVIIFIPFINNFTLFIYSFNVNRALKVAIASTLFNIISVILFFPFIQKISDILEKIY